MISGTPASALETGQFSFAASAAARKPSSSIPGTSPSTSSAIRTIPSPGWNVTVADVFSSSGGLPPFASPLASAIEKHDACAAAISSSGLVLPPDSSVDLLSAVHLKVLLLAWAYDRTYSFMDRLFNGPLQYRTHRYRLAGGRYSRNCDGALG